MKAKTTMAGATLAGSGFLATLTGISTASGTATVAVTGLGIALRAVMAATVVGAVVGVVGWLVTVAAEAGNAAQKVEK